MNSENLILFFIVAVFLVGFAVTFSSLLSRRSTNPQKSEPYECGIPTYGVSWLQFNVGYYLYAIIFLVFDVETVFVFPWATVMRSSKMTGFVEIIIFMFILALGLLYAWKKKALKWE